MEDASLPRPSVAAGAHSVTAWRPRVSAIVLAVALGVGAPAIAFAEGGSTGGAIGGSGGGGSGGGGDGGGSAGGKIAPPPEPEAPPKREAEPAPSHEAPDRSTRRAQRPRGDSGSKRASRPERNESGGGYDGSWSVHTSSRCGWSSNSSIRISGSHVSAPGLSGSVSPSGSLHMVSRYQGMTHTSSGHLSGSSGHGSFRRSDGCSGSWSASR